MNTKKLVRDVDFFLTIDLAWRAAVRIGIDPAKPWLSPDDCVMDETGVTFISGVTVQWNELGLGDLQRIDSLFSEYVAGWPSWMKTSAIDLSICGEHFAYSPRNPEWFFKESVKARLFHTWGCQLATGANSFIL